MLFRSREYQEEQNRMVRNSIAKHKRVISCMSTGSGKSVMMADLTLKAREKDKSVVIVLPRRSLVIQLSESFNNYGINHGVVMAGIRPYSSPRVQIVSIDTYKMRLAKGCIELLKADLLIIDEAHNVESQILDFVTFSISDELLTDHAIFIPKLNTAKDYDLWFRDIELDKILLEAMNKYAKAGMTKEYDEVERLQRKLDIFVTNIDKEGAEWVIEYAEAFDGQKTVRTVTMKPVYAVGFAEDLLFRLGKKVLMLSATILDVDVMARSLGIDRSELAAYRMKNRFPVENRPIYVRPVAKMTGGKDKMQEWMPKLIAGVEKILDQYPEQRGIIHTHNNAIMEALTSKIKPKYFARLITQREFQIGRAHV